MSQAQSTGMPNDLGQFLLDQAKLNPADYDAAYQSAQANWGKEKLRYRLSTSDDAKMAVTLTMSIATVTFLAVQGYGLFTLKSSRFSPLSLKRYLLVSAAPAAIGLICAGIGIWADGVEDPVIHFAWRENERRALREEAGNGQRNLIQLILESGSSNSRISASRLHACGCYGIFPKDQYAAAAVVLQAFSDMGGRAKYTLADSKQPEAARQMLSAAQGLTPAQ